MNNILPHLEWICPLLVTAFGALMTLFFDRLLPKEFRNVRMLMAAAVFIFIMYAGFSLCTLMNFYTEKLIAELNQPKKASFATWQYSEKAN